MKLFTIFTTLLALTYWPVEGSEDCQYVGSSGGVSGLTCDQNGKCGLVFSITTNLAPGRSLCINQGVLEYRFSVDPPVFHILREVVTWCSPFFGRNPKVETVRSKRTCFQENAEWNDTTPVGKRTVCCSPYKCAGLCGFKDCYYSVHYAIPEYDVYMVSDVGFGNPVYQVHFTVNGSDNSRGKGIDWLVSGSDQNPLGGKKILVNNLTGEFFIREDDFSMGPNDYCAVVYGPEFNPLWQFPGSTDNSNSVCLLENTFDCKATTCTREKPGTKLPFERDTFKATQHYVISKKRNPVVFTVSIPGTNFTGRFSNCSLDSFTWKLEGGDCPNKNHLEVTSDCQPSLDSDNCVLFLVETGVTYVYTIANKDPKATSCVVTAFNSFDYKSFEVPVSRRQCDEFNWEPYSRAPRPENDKQGFDFGMKLGIGLGGSLLLITIIAVGIFLITTFGARICPMLSSALIVANLGAGKESREVNTNNNSIVINNSFPSIMVPSNRHSRTTRVVEFRDLDEKTDEDSLQGGSAVRD